MIIAQAKASIDIALCSYTDSKNRNNVERKRDIGSQKQGISKSKYGAVLKSEVVFDFMVVFAAYGCFPALSESVLSTKKQKLLPKLIHEYFVKSTSKNCDEKKNKQILNRAIGEMKKERLSAKATGILSLLGQNFSNKRSDNPSTLEIVLLVHVFGTMKIRGAVMLADEQELVTIEWAKHELGGIELHLRPANEGAPVSNPFNAMTDEGDETEPKSLLTARVHHDDGRNFVKSCRAAFDGEDYAKEMIIPSDKDLQLPKKTDREGGDDDDDDDDDKESNKRPSELVEDKQGKNKKQKTDTEADSSDKNATVRPDEVDEVKTVGFVSVATGDLAGSKGDDDEDMDFISHEIKDFFDMDLSKVSEKKRKDFMERMREWFRCKEDDILMNENEEEEHELLQGLIAGDTAAKKDGKRSSDMEGVLMAALRNARMRENFKDDFIDKSDVSRYTKTQMKKINEWRKGACNEENKTAREKVESFARNLEIRVRLVSAIGDEWTEETYGPTNPEKYAVTILAKNDGGEDITNDQTTTYKYYVRKRLNE